MCFFFWADHRAADSRGSQRYEKDFAPFKVIRNLDAIDAAAAAAAFIIIIVVWILQLFSSLFLEIPPNAHTHTRTSIDCYQLVGLQLPKRAQPQAISEHLECLNTIENVDVAIEKISSCGDLEEMVEVVKADRIVSFLISIIFFLLLVLFWKCSTRGLFLVEWIKWNRATSKACGT